ISCATALAAAALAVSSLDNPADYRDEGHVGFGHFGSPSHAASDFVFMRDQGAVQLGIVARSRRSPPSCLDDSMVVRKKHRARPDPFVPPPRVPFARLSRH